MSLDFGVALSGPPIKLNEALVMMESRLQALGFTRTSPVFPAAFDKLRGVFNESTGAHPAVAGFDSTSDVRGAVAGWAGASVEYQHSGCCIYLLLAEAASTHFNCYIDIGDRALRRLFAQDQSRIFHAAILAAADALGSAAGFGGLELAFEPYTPEQALQNIWSYPEEAGATSWIGLVPFSAMSEEHLEQNCAGRFRITPVTVGFWFLEANEYIDFYTGTS